MLKSIRARIVAMGAGGIMLLAVVVAGTASAGNFLANAHFATRYIQQTPSNLPPNCTGNDCVYVSNIDDQAYFKNSSGVSSVIGSSPVASVSSGGYTNANVTVDAFGRITSITNGLAPAGGGYTTIQTNGSNVTQRSPLNLVGADVACVDNSGSTRTDCTFSPLGWFNTASAPYSADLTGAVDSTAAIQSAVTAAEGGRSGTVYLPCGKFLVAGSVTMHKGTTLAGCSGSANNDAFGTSIKHASNGNLFVWDGNSATSAAGVGGGIRDMFIEKAIGFSGGDAIYLVSTDDNHRPGEFIVRNIVVGGQNNSAMWSHGFHLDGTASNISGGRGVRSVYFDKARFNACDDTTFPNQCVWLNQPTHVYAPYLQIEPVGGTGTVGMTVEGNFDDVFLYGVEINGTLVINQPPDAGYTPHVLIMGHVGTAFINNATTISGRAVITTASVTNVGASFDVISPGTSSKTSGTWDNTGQTIVRDKGTPIAGTVFGVRDSIGNFMLNVTDNAPITLASLLADGPTAVAAISNSILAWVNTGAKLHSFRNGNVEKAYVREDGFYSSSAGFSGPTIGPSFTQQHTIPAVASDTMCLLAASQTLAAKTLTAPVINGATSSGSTAFDLSGSTGTFSFPTGGVANAPLLSAGATASGSSAIDLSGSSGTFKTPTGANTFGGSSNTFTALPTLPAGTGTATGRPSVTVWADATVVSSVTTGETDASVFTMPANTLAVNGQALHCYAAFNHAANTNSATGKLYFNGTALGNTASATSGDVLNMDYTWVRTSSSVLTSKGLIMHDAGALSGSRGTVSAVNYAGSIIIKTTVTGATTNGDLSSSYLRCEWLPN